MQCEMSDCVTRRTAISASVPGDAISFPLATPIPIIAVPEIRGGRQRGRGTLDEQGVCVWGEFVPRVFVDEDEVRIDRIVFAVEVGGDDVDGVREGGGNLVRAIMVCERHH